MKTAKQKIENWLDECGYVEGKSCVVYMDFSYKSPTIESSRFFNTEWKVKILSLTNSDGTVHLPPADLHEDDKLEPVETIGGKLLNEFMNTPIEDVKLESLLVHIVTAIRDLELALEAKVG